jgi:hypothetical protein
MVLTSFFRLKLSEEAIKKDIPAANIRRLTLDLASLSGVRKAAEEVNAYSEPIHVGYHPSIDTVRSCLFRSSSTTRLLQLVPSSSPWTDWRIKWEPTMSAHSSSQSSSPPNSWRPRHRATHPELSSSLAAPTHLAPVSTLTRSSTRSQRTIVALLLIFRPSLRTSSLRLSFLDVLREQ